MQAACAAPAADQGRDGAVSSHARNLRRFDHRYQPYGQLGDPCVYCGIRADTMDHVPPLRTVEMMADADIDRANLRKYPACRECNSWLADCRLTGLTNRRAIVREKIRKKYKRLLRMPRWDEDELAELSEQFAEFMRKSSDAADIAKRRIGWGR